MTLRHHWKSKRSVQDSGAQAERGAFGGIASSNSPVGGGPAGGFGSGLGRGWRGGGADTQDHRRDASHEIGDDASRAGLILATVTAAEIGQIDRFVDAPHWAGYAGAVPRVQSSILPNPKPQSESRSLKV